MSASKLTLDERVRRRWGKGSPTRVTLVTSIFSAAVAGPATAALYWVSEGKIPDRPAELIGMALLVFLIIFLPLLLLTLFVNSRRADLALMGGSAAGEGVEPGWSGGYGGHHHGDGGGHGGDCGGDGGGH